MNIYNNKKTFFYKLKSSCKKEWSEYTNHKFLSDLVSNKLPDKNFKNYLVQDYVFLQQFLKILALSVYKSNSFEEINRSVNFIKGIDHEIKLHINYCKKWKIPLKSLNNIVVEKANSSYTDHVLVWVKMEIILISSHAYQYVSLAMVRLGLIFLKLKTGKKVNIVLGLKCIHQKNTNK